MITDVVRNNPKQLTVHFGGHRGKLIRQKYMSMVCELPATEDKVIKLQKIFGEIDEDTTSYTHRSPTGLLFATQFAQPALTIMEMARFEDMKSKGLISTESNFAGHSLGEYSALATIAGIMPIERLLSTVFYRGLTMQLAVERDATGRSNFGMAAVDPSRISTGEQIREASSDEVLMKRIAFDQQNLRTLVECVAEETGSLLEIVNYNVDGKQYVCAGDLQALDCLTTAANHLAAERTEVKQQLSSKPADELRAYFQAIVKECAVSTQRKPGPLELKRGSATIPLKGIDVPFHSSFLLPSMESFRKVLLQNINEESIDATKLIGKYVPNLTAEPFRISKDYFETVYALTKSRRIEEVLAKWDTYEDVESDKGGDVADRAPASVLCH